MTEQSVVDALNDIPEVQTVDVTNGAKKDGLYQVRDVQYSTTSNNVARFNSFKLLVVYPGTEDEAVFYHTSVPDILRPDPDPVDPPRAFHLTETQIKNGLENLNQGWTVLRVNQARDGEFDRVTVIANNGTTAVTKSYLVWDENGSKEYKEIQ